jgi:hypothetical protein
MYAQLDEPDCLSSVFGHPDQIGLARTLYKMKVHRARMLNLPYHIGTITRKVEFQMHCCGLTHTHVSQKLPSMSSQEVTPPSPAQALLNVWMIRNWIVLVWNVSVACGAKQRPHPNDADSIAQSRTEKVCRRICRS